MGIPPKREGLCLSAPTDKNNILLKKFSAEIRESRDIAKKKKSDEGRKHEESTNQTGFTQTPRVSQTYLEEKTHTNSERFQSKFCVEETLFKLQV